MGPTGAVVAIVVVAVAAGIYAATHWQRASPAAAPASGNAQPRNTARPASANAATPAGLATAPPADELTVSDPAALFQQSTNYLELARKLLPFAKSGDIAAQYWLQRALRRCDLDYESSIQEAATDGALSQDEVAEIVRNDTRVDAAEVRLIFDQCFPLSTSGAEAFGDSDDWRENSAKGGYPLALAELADSRAADALNDDTAAGADVRTESLRLARDALRTGDAEVVMRLAGVAFYMNSADEKWDDGFRARNIWYLAACQRGADCGPQSTRTRRWCRGDPHCQPFETLADLMRRQAPADFAAMENRAREINELIDGKKWDELPFVEVR
jgi:hypothetical protein